MLIHRTHSKPATADDCFAAMERHNAGPQKNPVAVAAPASPAPTGDILYGGAAIASWMFPNEKPDRARRRVFHLWAHHSARKERAGFFKLKGALCLSKSQWLAFHGLA